MTPVHLVVVAGFALLGAELAARASERWPEGLAAAAEEHRQALNRKEALTRDGSLASPVGIQEAVQFDLQSHACHRGPAQAYREYGEASVAPDATTGTPRSGRGAGDERAQVQYGYRVWFRQALTLEEMFAKPWREGSDGAIEVEFRRVGGRWAPMGKRELLSRKQGPGAAKEAMGDPETGRGSHRNPRRGGGR